MVSDVTLRPLPEPIDEIAVGQLVEGVSGGCFHEWFNERKTEENVLAGQAYFNAPSPSKEPERHSPSQLKQCPRKTSYRRQNAPKEGETPQGIFWVGEQIEEELVVPFLLDAVAVEGTYVTNSIWIDSTIQTGGFELQLRGVTDPAITTETGEPLVVFEVKSTTSVEYLDGPRAHHRAQLHAYLYALNEEHEDRGIPGVVLYVDRESLQAKVFHESFDAEFWEDIVAWMRELAEYEIAEQLPPAAPEHEWECEYCDYRERCGNGGEAFKDVGHTGLLPLFDGYSESRLQEYLEAHPGAKLTPTLAHEHPGLAERYGVYNWSCPSCLTRFAWDEPDWHGDTDDPPWCPVCVSDETLVALSGPDPAEQTGSEP
jgi:CRISPR/Cas system-associated exonuclease Cas4 (RecB family)